MTFRRRLLLLAGLAVLALALPVGLYALDQSTHASLAPRALAALLDSDDAPVVIDVRSPEEYAAGHIPGALNVPFQTMSARAAEVCAAGERLVLTCAHGPRACLARLALDAPAGVEVLYLAGHMRAWQAAGLPLESAAPDR